MIPWRRAWQPTHVFLPGESHGQRAWKAADLRVAQSQTGLKWLHGSSSKVPHQMARGEWDELGDGVDIIYTTDTKFQFSSVQSSRWVLSDFLQPHGTAAHQAFPVHHQLPESTQTHVHWVGGYHPTISSSVVPFSRLQSFPASASFPMSPFFPSGGQSIGMSASASVLPMDVQDWFPLGWTALGFHYNSTLTSIHHHWKNQSFE